MVLRRPSDHAVSVGDGESVATTTGVFDAVHRPREPDCRQARRTWVMLRGPGKDREAVVHQVNDGFSVEGA